MASNPKMEYQIFLCIFQKNSAMTTLGLKEFFHFLQSWFGKYKKKSGTYYEKWVGRHASFPPRRSVKGDFCIHTYTT